MLVAPDARRQRCPIGRHRARLPTEARRHRRPIGRRRGAERRRQRGGAATGGIRIKGGHTQRRRHRRRRWHDRRPGGRKPTGRDTSWRVHPAEKSRPAGPSAAVTERTATALTDRAVASFVRSRSMTGSEKRHADHILDRFRSGVGLINRVALRGQERLRPPRKVPRCKSSS